MKNIILLISLFSFTAKAQLINTIAGNGSSISSGDGGTATSAGIYGPNGVVYDNLGNLYITEYYANYIRKVSTSGIISTIGGNGVAGYSGDGGPATAATINKPIKIAIDASNNLYFAELNNNCIRKITPSGIITTVAGNGLSGYSGDGGPATNARLSHPTGVSLDPSGNIYITDYSNSVIRKVTTAGIISTIAGTGIAGSIGDGGPATSAQLNQPWGTTIDAAGNLYILDMMNHKIRKVSSVGIISTFAGTGSSGFSGDGGPATAAMFNQPSGMTFDSTGNIFITDQLNYRVRKISSAGLITTVCGTGIAGYSGDGGAATAAQINQANDLVYSPSGLVFTDNNNNRVRRIQSCLGTLITSPAHDTVNEGVDAKYYVVTTMLAPTYQWQEDPGTGFVDLANVWPYSGVNTDTLTISHTSIFLHATHYRCIVAGGACSDTSASAILIVRTPTGSNITTAGTMQVFPNPATDRLNITSPSNSPVRDIQLINGMGEVIYHQADPGSSFSINIAGFARGIYFIRLQTNLEYVTRKIVIN